LENQVEEMSMQEIEEVSGGSLASAIGYAVGFVLGAGGSNMRAIDGSGIMMLSAMQYGA
jgi:hypothetical protein